MQIKYYLTILGLVLCTINTTSNTAEELLNKGRECIRYSQYETATDLLTKALKISPITSDSLLGHIHINLGITYRLREKYSLSLNQLKLANKLFNKNNLVNDIAYSEITLVDYYRDLYHFKDAKYYLDRIKTKLSKISSDNKAFYFNRLAAVESEIGTNFDTIISYAELAIKHSIITGNKHIEAESYSEIGALVYRRDPQRAIKNFNKALNLFKEIGNIRYQVDILLNFAWLHYRHKNYKKVLEYCNEGLNLIGENNWNSVLEHILFLQYKSSEKLGNLTQSFKSLKRYYKVLEENHELRWAKVLASEKSKHEIEDEKNSLNHQLLKIEHSNIDAKFNNFQKNIIIIFVVILSLIVLILIKLNKKASIASRRLNNLVSQKNILVKEVHHRVKNNLTLISSMLYLRSVYAKDTVESDLIEEGQNRIQSISLIHQNLYDVGDCTKIDFEKYLNQLIAKLKSQFKMTSHLDINIECSTINISSSSAVSLGLISNELITNSFKLAFNNTENPVISIKITDSPTQINIRYYDNRLLKMNKKDFKESSIFESRLIKVLVSQIDGEIQYTNKEFSEYVISINK